jgi:phosphonate transport system ATP-binding protein
VASAPGLRPGAPPPGPDGDGHLELRGLTLERGGRTLVRGLELTLPRGSVLAVIGPSGAGKSSLLAALAGLVAPSAGEVRYRDEAGARVPPAAMRGRLGLVFQDLRLVPTLSLLDNVLCGRLARRSSWATLPGLPRGGRDEALALLGALGIEGLAGRWACEVSGGERQRAAIARALFMEPAVILADEPVSALDVEGAARALSVLRAEALRLGATVVFVLHDPPLVERFADEVLAVDPRLERGFRLERAPVAAREATARPSA